MFRKVCPSQLSAMSPARICIIKPSALGDVVQSLPLLPVIKTRFPDAEISWVINRELTDLISGHPSLSDVIPFDRTGGWREWYSLLSTLQSRRFDMVFDLQGLLRTGVMTMATRAPVRVGLQTAREGSSLTTNCVIADTSKIVPAHARIWRVAESLGFGDHPRETRIIVSSADEEWADSLLAPLPRPITAVHPGARWETKRWPVNQFAHLMERGTQEWHGSTVILGSRGERSHAEHLKQLMSEGVKRHSRAVQTPIVNLAGQTTLKQLAALLSRVDLVVSNDSGPMHLAAGLGTPTLGLFTCTSAMRSGPAGSQHELVSTTVPCAASYCKKCPVSGNGNLACLTELNVDRVWQGLERLVSKNKIEPNQETSAA